MLHSSINVNALRSLFADRVPPTEPLSEVFHENTKYTRAHYLEQALRVGRHLHSQQAVHAMSRNFKVFRFAEKVLLPRPAQARMPLALALRERVSTRVFSGQHLPLNVLANVLTPAAGCNRRVTARDFPSVSLHFRSYPSGGGEYPIELYPILLKVSEVTPRVTHFDPRECTLSTVTRGLAMQDVAQCLMHSESTLSSAAVLLVLTALFERTTVKYGDRGYRLALLEAGHVAQNLCLTAAAAGLGSLAWGGFYDDELNQLIGVDGVNEAAVHCLFLGGRPG
jgi:SagB-type dehydrogenase family enzyme